MEKKEKQKVEWGTELSLPSSADLRGRQSVRATFKLTEMAINAVTIVSTHLGIKQKSLFDHLIDDTQSLDVIAKEVRSDVFNELERVQKTYVISRKTLSCLGEASKRFAAPRDALVEYSIQRLLPIIKEEREKHRKRKEILSELTEYLEQGEAILKKSRKLLGEEDPVYNNLENAMTVTRNVQKSIKSFVERGAIIEEF
jgi:predicted transcriptional regulator